MTWIPLICTCLPGEMDHFVGITPAQDLSFSKQLTSRDVVSPFWLIAMGHRPLGPPCRNDVVCSSVSSCGPKS